MTLNFRRGTVRQRDRLQRRYGNSQYRLIGDGREIKRVFYYDGRRRIVGVNLTDKNGRSYLTPQGEIAVEFLKLRTIRLVKK